MYTDGIGRRFCGDFGGGRYMSGIISAWVLGVCAVSLITSAAGAAVGEGRQAGILRLIGAAATVLVLLTPLKSGDADLKEEFQIFRDAFSESAELEEIAMQAGTMAAQHIQAYIMQQAEAQGIACSVQAQCSYTDGAFYLESCRIVYQTQLPAEEQTAFEENMAQALGIDKKYITGR